jgi:hypothetical protein
VAGPPVSQLVKAGEVCTSPCYRAVLTVGQPTQNQTKMTSPSDRMQGGVNGAAGTLA